jgi:hypothetical protein
MASMATLEERNFSKRVKFIGTVEQEPPRTKSTKSILEQMDETEKRFFPDSSPIASSASKRTKMFGSSPPRPGSDQTSTPLINNNNIVGVRKRKGTKQQGISIVEFDEDDENDPKSKSGKFCHCNECYADAAGHVVASPSKNGRSPPPPPRFGLISAGKKMVTFGESSFLGSSALSPTLCDKGTGTDAEMDSRPEVIIRYWISVNNYKDFLFFCSV